MVAGRAGLPMSFVLHGLLELGAAVVLGAWARGGGGTDPPTTDRCKT